MGQRRVPDPLWLVESFLNSIDVERGQDYLDSVAHFRSWLAVHREAAAAQTANPADLELARQLRYALRAEAAAHHHGELTDRTWLDDLARAVPLRARATGQGIGLGPAEGGVRGVLGEILAAVVLADQDGTWRRMKICREGACQVAYYDRSKNASRCWCSMQICGNRNKTRAYRGRLRESRRRKPAPVSAVGSAGPAAAP